MFKSLIQNLRLIIRMTVRDVVGRYKGSAFGILWSFFNPLIMLAVYSFVFGLVFKAKWGVETDVNFSIVLFSGLIFHGLLAECLLRAPATIVGNSNYVKKVVFPLESLAWVSVLSALFHFTISLLVLAVANIILGGAMTLNWLYLPLVILPLLLVCIGVSWLLSSLGVFMRDIGQITGILATIMLFLCPIFYPLEVIPEQYQVYILLNPLSFIVEQARSIVVYGNTPDFFGLAIYGGFALVFAQLAYIWFSKTKRGFADVL